MWHAILNHEISKARTAGDTLRLNLLRTLLDRLENAPLTQSQLPVEAWQVTTEQLSTELHQAMAGTREADHYAFAKQELETLQALLAHVEGCPLSG